MTYTIRPMETEDYNSVIALWSKTDGIALSDTDEKLPMQVFLNRNPRLSLVAHCGDELVGAVLCSQDGRRGYLHHLAVRKEFSRPTQQQRGPLLEGWVASLLRSYRDYRGLFDDWFYWAPGEASLTEVDFLVRRGKKLVAMEVKASPRFSEKAVRGLRAVSELKGLVRRLVVYTGDRVLKTEDGIDVLPVAAFVKLVETGDVFP